VIGDGQILGALAGLLLGIADGAGEAAFQGIIALVAELLLPTTGIICGRKKKDVDRIYIFHDNNVTNPRRKICNETAAKTFDSPLCISIKNKSWQQTFCEMLSKSPDDLWAD